MKQERPSKKQREILTFIDNFISGHGYVPSYREIARGLGYSAVSTVQVHLDNLIAKGLLRKKDNSARSLEVVGASSEFISSGVSDSQEKWLVQQIGLRFDRTEESKEFSVEEVDELYVLVGALKVLGFTAAASSFTARLAKLKNK